MIGTRADTGTSPCNLGITGIRQAAPISAEVVEHAVTVGVTGACKQLPASGGGDGGGPGNGGQFVGTERVGGGGGTVC